jgi:hypothetical protein
MPPAHFQLTGLVASFVLAFLDSKKGTVTPRVGVTVLQIVFPDYHFSVLDWTGLDGTEMN